MNKKPVIVFGTKFIAELLVKDIQKNNADFNIAAFCEDDEYIKEGDFYGKPIMGLSKIRTEYPPEQYDMISTVEGMRQLRNRLILFNKLADLGYNLVNYISPVSDVADSVRMGKSNIVLPFVHIGPNTAIGNANIFQWSVILGHDSVVGNGNMFIGGCAIAGTCTIGNGCYFGINSTVVDRVHIANETLVGAASVIYKNTIPHSFYLGNPARIISTHEETGIIFDINHFEDGRK
jgi:sugar O-acyltransferase (sialic acid O-acetyltransferase NeuD family)